MSLTTLLLSRMAFSFLASFLAIWVWSRTREEAWLFIVAGILVSFIALMIEVLSQLGILPILLTESMPIPLWFAVLQILPYLFYALGLGFYLYGNRQY